MTVKRTRLVLRTHPCVLPIKLPPYKSHSILLMKSQLVPVMVWCCQAIHHYLSRCWHSFMSPYSARPNELIRLWVFVGDAHFVIRSIFELKNSQTSIGYMTWWLHQMEKFPALLVLCYWHFVYSTVCSGADQRKQLSSASLAFVMGIHRWPVNSVHKVSQDILRHLNWQENSMPYFWPT